MRTKTRARRRSSKSSRRSVSATARPLPCPIADHSSNAEEDEEENLTNGMEMDVSSENNGTESNESSDVEIVNTCLKCNKGGKLLICCGSGCAICLHDECIPRNPKYDEDGNFYCPYCWYKIHQSRAQELKKIALLAKQALRDFMDSKPEGVVDDEARQSDWKMDEGNANGRKHFNKVDVVDGAQNWTREGDKHHQTDKSTVAVGHEKMSGTHEFEVRKRMEREKGDGQVGVEPNAEMHQDKGREEASDDHCMEEEAAVRSKSEALEGCEANQGRTWSAEEMHKEARPADGTAGDGVSDAPGMSASYNETVAVRVRSSKKRANQNDDSPKKSPLHSHNSTADEAGNQNKKTSSLKKTAKPQAPARKSTNLTFHHEKRKRLHWRPEEEEMLREGVQKFSSTVNKNLPWRKILEFGHHVFDGSRTPADLKDKWRNMVVKDSVSK